MRIWLNGINKTCLGTPIEIVKKILRDAIHLHAVVGYVAPAEPTDAQIDVYVNEVAARLNVAFTGDTQAARCAAFLCWHIRARYFVDLQPTLRVVEFRCGAQRDWALVELAAGMELRCRDLPMPIEGKWPWRLPTDADRTQPHPFMRNASDDRCAICEEPHRK